MVGFAFLGGSGGFGDSWGDVGFFLDGKLIWFGGVPDGTLEVLDVLGVSGTASVKTFVALPNSVEIFLGKGYAKHEQDLGDDVALGEFTNMLGSSSKSSCL